MGFTCPDCGRNHDEYKHYAIHHSKSHGDKHPLVAYHGVEKIQSLYDQMSANKLADELGVSTNATRRAIKETDEITHRGRSEAAKLEWGKIDAPDREERLQPAREAVRTNTAGFYTNKRGREISATTEGDVKVHRLVAVAMHGFDAVTDMHVHHCNRIPWDNRPDNLEVMTPSEHIKHHHEQRRQENSP